MARYPEEGHHGPEEIRDALCQGKGHTMVVRPGYGLDDLHVGDSSSTLLKRFGKPARKTSGGKLRQHWLYPDRGLECIVSRNSGKILSIFFQSAWSLDSPNHTPLFGATSEEIQRIFSKPDKEGGGFLLSTGTYFKKWTSYRAGIGFDFNREDRVVQVVVFRKQREVKRKLAAQHSASSTRQIAALRQS